MGCNLAELDPERNFESVQRAYPHAEIVTAPGRSYGFIVAQNCEVRYVETMDANSTDISSDIRLMKMPNCDMDPPAEVSLHNDSR